MLQLLEFFQDLNYSITFASPARETDHMVSLEGLGIEKKIIKVNDSHFDDFIKSLQPDIVLFDRFMMEEQFGWRVDKYCPGAIRILETSDLHCLRHARQTATKANREVTSQDYLSDIATREIASIYRCDLSLMISQFEVTLLEDFFNVDRQLLIFLPFMPPPNDKNKRLKSYHQRSDFLSIGNFLHPPNWDAVLQLKQKIWPGIKKKLPSAKLNVFGAYASKKVYQLHNEKQGFLVQGRAEDALRAMENVRVNLAPLRFGAGLKGKLLDSMTAGTPSVTTSIGAESMHADLPWNGAITDDWETFIEKAVSLHENEIAWDKAQQQGFEILETVYDKRKHFQHLSARLSELINHLDTLRQNNFTGLMLKHHHLKSTEYMSKWIEAKNRLAAATSHY